MPIALDGVAEVAGHPGHLGIDVLAGGDASPSEDEPDRRMAGDAAPCIPAQARILLDFGQELLEVLGLEDGIGE